MNTSPPHSGVSAEPVSLFAADGYRLAARRYAAAGDCRARLIVAGATGVPQGFYRRFAEHAAALGFEVLTLDYRGIGLSRPPSLRGFEMDYLDWARLDLAAAVDAQPDDGLPLVMVGHSYGGHAFGLLPNHARVQRFVTLATGAGWHGWMPPLERVRVLAMWRLIGPLLTRWKGYLPWSLLGMGEDLPLGVYRQWRHWCRFPRYFFDDPAMRGQGLAEGFAAVRTPIVALNASDDHWAPPASRDAFMAAYRNAPCRTLTLHPASLGLKAIGHMGYFRSSARPLWDEVLGWLGENTAPALPTRQRGLGGA
jgi:predicted alpha/beta hydrolase